MEHTYILSYNGLVTGSKNLRKHNQVEAKKHQYTTNNDGYDYKDQQDNLIFQYFKKYDLPDQGKGKLDEPFFDGYLAFPYL